MTSCRLIARILIPARKDIPQEQPLQKRLAMRLRGNDDTRTSSPKCSTNKFAQSVEKRRVVPTEKN